MASDPPLCAGLALVHAVDMSAGRGGLVYLHTDKAPEQLERVTALCTGQLKVPESVLCVDAARSPYVQMFCMVGDGTGAGLIKSRRNLARPGQL